MGGFAVGSRYARLAAGTVAMGLVRTNRPAPTAVAERATDERSERHADQADADTQMGLDLSTQGTS